MQRRLLPNALIYVLLVVVVTACGGSGGGTSAPSVTQESAGPVINWDKSSGTVVVRLDRLIENEPKVQRLNRLPACTVYGDGHVVWVNTIPPNGEETLEAYVGEVGFRAFLEFIIRDQKFYSIPDYAADELPPAQDSALESITLNVNQAMRTIRSYRAWQGNTYGAILERCRKLSDTRALYVPSGGWVTVFEQPRKPGSLENGWPPTAPFKMAEAAASGAAVWVQGAALRQLWNVQRQTLGQTLWLEKDKAYRVAIQVPGISRDAPPAPPGSTTPTPTPAPTTEP
jgi:hypothetical protein